MMPHSLAEECEDYVDAYGDQVIELLAQEIDPSQVRKKKKNYCSVEFVGSIVFALLT